MVIEINIHGTKLESIQQKQKGTDEVIGLIRPPLEVEGKEDDTNDS